MFSSYLEFMFSFLEVGSFLFICLLFATAPEQPLLRTDGYATNSWGAAQARCRNLGGNLATVVDASENTVCGASY